MVNVRPYIALCLHLYIYSDIYCLLTANDWWFRSYLHQWPSFPITRCIEHNIDRYISFARALTSKYTQWPVYLQWTFHMSTCRGHVNSIVHRGSGVGFLCCRFQQFTLAISGIIYACKFPEISSTILWLQQGPFSLTWFNFNIGMGE